MIHLEDLLWGFSVISLSFYFLQSLVRVISMASLCLTSPVSSSSSSSSTPLLSPLSWVTQLVVEKHHQNQEEGNSNNHIRKEMAQICEKKQNLRKEKGTMPLEAHEKNLNDKCFGEEESFCKIGKLKKRPTRLVVPEYCPKLEFGLKDEVLEKKEFEIQGKDFFLASKKGRRQFMEDDYGVMLDIHGDSKQAIFAVIDGHGGRAAADYVAKNLGNNIVKSLQVGDNYPPEEAIRSGYMITDKEFLSQGVSSGACAASVLVKDGELHVANVGDCRVVLCRKGVAHTLTSDHRLSREDERLRIENSGGYVHCRNGIWRVQGSLAISRAIGDGHLKEWIISEPEIKTIQLTSHCEFLIMASDGLWDKVKEQEAVDVVLGGKNAKEACKRLVDISFSRGNLDDVTVMLINLQNFILNSC